MDGEDEEDEEQSRMSLFFLQPLVFYHSYAPQVCGTLWFLITMVFILTPQFLTVPVGMGPAKGEGLTGAGVVLSSDTLECTCLFTTCMHETHQHRHALSVQSH